MRIRMCPDEGVASDNHYCDRGCDQSRCLNQSSALARVKEQEQRQRGCVKYRKHDLRGGKLPRDVGQGKVQKYVCSFSRGFQFSCNFNLPGHIHLGLRPETAGQKLSWFISFSHAPDSSSVSRQTTCLLLPCPWSLCLGPRCSIKEAPELGFCLDTEAGPCQIYGVKSALSDEMEEGPSRVSRSQTK